MTDRAPLRSIQRRNRIAKLNLGSIAPRYFFESGMFSHLNPLRSVVAEMAMPASYADEPSGLRPLRTVGPFLRGNLRTLSRRVMYSYFVLSFLFASIELCNGIPLVTLGLLSGICHWWESAMDGTLVAAGMVMLRALPLILGIQFTLRWLHFDISTEPHRPIHSYLESERIAGSDGPDQVRTRRQP
jgi:dolichol-phosphate mannosyltransferase